MVVKNLNKFVFNDKLEIQGQSLKGQKFDWSQKVDLFQRLEGRIPSSELGLDIRLKGHFSSRSLEDFFPKPSRVDQTNHKS